MYGTLFATFDQNQFGCNHIQVVKRLITAGAHMGNSGASLPASLLYRPFTRGDCRGDRLRHLRSVNSVVNQSINQSVYYAQ